MHLFRHLFLAASGALAIVLVASAVRAAPPPDSDGRIAIAPVAPGLPGFSVPMRSMRELRYAGMVRQETDFTCGAAALATVLQQMFGRSISEREIINDMLAHTDREEVRSRGFSMLDMKHYLERHGLRGRGYKIDARVLMTVKIPVIALQTTRQYAHFVVLKRIHAGIAYIADPALGHRQIPVEEFVAAWNGIVFAVLGDGRQADNALVASSIPRAAQDRAAIVTRALPPLQEFGLFGIDTF